MSELEEMKLRLGITGNQDDSLIGLLLSDAQEIINSHTQFPKSYEWLRKEAVILAYNQRGAEGNKSESSGTFSHSWAYSIMSEFIRTSMRANYVV